MPTIADHWVRLTDQRLAVILDGPREQDVEGDETDQEYLEYLEAFAERIASWIEDGLETW